MMKIVCHVIAVLLCLFLVTINQACAEVEHGAHHGHGPAKLSLDHGKKWPTDEPLRKAMKTLRAAFAGHLHTLHKGQLTAVEYNALGEKTEKAVGSIMAQCKLAPEADAMLHLIIADMIEGADILTGKAIGKPRSGAHQIVSALNNYGRYFDHPGWVRLR